MTSTYARWVHPLDPSTIDVLDRFGETCRISGTCIATPTHACGWRYVTGRHGRTSSVEKLVCPAHGTKFATKHHLNMGEPQPPRTTALDRAAAGLATIGKPADALILARVHKPRNNNTWYLEYTSSAGASLAATYRPLPGTTPTTSLTDAITAAETLLARNDSLVPTGAWECSATEARTTLATAWQVKPWLHHMWTFTVTLRPPTEYEQRRFRPGMWTLTRVLDDRFTPAVDELGWHNMTIGRALTVATGLLRTQRWLVADDDWWTCDDPNTVSQHGWHPDQLPAQHAHAKAASHAQ